MFGNVVLGIDAGLFREAIEKEQRTKCVDRSADLTPSDLRKVISTFRHGVGGFGTLQIPDDPDAQLEQAIQAVFDSWYGRRAVAYRELQGIPHDLGTAVSVVAMVYGNVDENSGAGVLFTRSPSTGEQALYGEYLLNAQGEDVVAGTATPVGIAGLREALPDAYRELAAIAGLLEGHYRDVQDVEFTVEQGRVYVLQTRVGKRSAGAAVKTAVDMADEGLITRREALLRVDPQQVYQMLLPRFDEAATEEAKREGRLLAQGVGASPGAATGKVVFSPESASELGTKGVRVVLVRPETNAEDVHGMVRSAGGLTSRGGATSHAAVVARGLGIPCVTGTGSIEVNPAKGYLRCGELKVFEGEEISVDGATGEVFLGPIATSRPRSLDDPELGRLLGWADSERRLGIWANADTAADAQAARGLGAEGIGLCRTEHMFFEPERLSLVREMILSAHRSVQLPEDKRAQESYRESLEQLERLQTADFEGLFRAMDGRPVVIRLLDPPLHEFLPNRDQLMAETLALKADGQSPARRSELAAKEALLLAVEEMREVNPMLGLRGCRVGLMYPGIYEMQTRAVLKAARNVEADGVLARPEIMVPLVSHGNEMFLVRRRLEATMQAFHGEVGGATGYRIGAMIETPRAALTADRIAESAEFFSFGTNDLTQTTFAFSRDDAEGKFLMRYVQEQVLPEDPFEVLDREGVGRLVEMACELGRKARPDLELGICGEHGGDPASIDFFHRAGLDYVSCSPLRVPVARLAAAQAAIRSETEPRAQAWAAAAGARSADGPTPTP